jgi:glycosyltransferase 2 family protein
MHQMRRLVPYLVMIAFAGWCIVSLRGDLANLSLAPVIHSWDLVLLAAALSLTNYLLRIVRWRAYLERLGHRVSYRFASLTFTAGFAYTLSPGKVGEMVRARYYIPLGIPLSDVAAAFFTERFLDLVAMVALATLLIATSSRYEGTIILGAGAAVVGLLALSLLPWDRVASQVKSADRIPRLLRSPLAKVASMLASTRALLRPRLLLMGFALGLLAWALEGIGLGLLSSMFPPAHLDLAEAIGIYGVAVLIGGLSFLPGGLGSTEAVMTGLLATQGFSVSQAFLVTLTCRLVTLWLGVCIGWLAVLALRTRKMIEVAPWQ